MERKIVFVSAGSSHGGAEIFLHGLFQESKSRGLDTKFVDITSNGTQMERRGYLELIYMLRTSTDPMVIISSHAYINIIVGVFRKNNLHLQVARESTFLFDRFGLLKTTILQVLYKMVVPRYDVWITQSYQMSEYFYTKIGTRSKVILNYIGDSTSKDNISNRDAILFIGKLNSNKGILLLLEAIKYLASKNIFPDVKVLGNGDLEANARSYCKENNLYNVTFYGHVEKVVCEEYSNCRVGLILSEIEGFPNSLINYFQLNTGMILSTFYVEELRNTRVVKIERSSQLLAEVLEDVFSAGSFSPRNTSKVMPFPSVREYLEIILNEIQ